MSIDLITLGEIMLRYAAAGGEVLEQATRFDVRPAGAESNVVICGKRIGLNTGYISRLPNHALGRMAEHAISIHGVDTSRIIWADASERVGTYYIDLGVPPRPPNVIYDRAGSAVTRLTVDMVDWDYVAQARIFHATGITLALSDSLRDVIRRGLTIAREAGNTTSFDTNYRAKLWSPDEAYKTIAPLLPQIDILRMGLEEAHVVFKVTGTAQEVAKHLFETYTPKVVILSNEGNDVVAYDGQQYYTRTPYNVQIVDPIGAGDAFTAGFLTGYLEDGIERGMDMAMALGSLTLTYVGDVPWCTRADVERLIEQKHIPYR
ncbi:MAG: sugar kinase [Chloroflexi bacterium]|nr:MAG: sugar kinase [Phototrophicales bacterium]RMF79717.1 MAG: sugar kinase [Chloroflexota bacterium]